MAYSEDHPAACPGCLATGASLRNMRARQANPDSLEYLLWQCQSCALQFWTPLEMVQEIYEDEGFEAYTDYHSGSRDFPAWARGLFVELSPTTGRSLDIGCADGAVVERLIAHGFSAFGLDLDSKSLEVGKNTKGLANLFHGTLESAVAGHPEFLQYFDLISFFEVLEHQTAPLEFLDLVRQVAKPGARIAGSVPNRRRFLVTLDRMLGEGDYPPHHFLWFSSRALKQMLVQAGFENVHICHAKTPGLTGRFRSSRHILLRLMVRNHSEKSKRMIAPIATLLAFPASLVLALGDWLQPPHLYFTCSVRR